jgi:hypothetical protein
MSEVNQEREIALLKQQLASYRFPPIAPKRVIFDSSNKQSFVDGILSYVIRKPKMPKITLSQEREISQLHNILASYKFPRNSITVDTTNFVDGLRNYVKKKPKLEEKIEMQNWASKVEKTPVNPTSKAPIHANKMKRWKTESFLHSRKIQPITELAPSEEEMQAAPTDSKPFSKYSEI